MKEYLTTIFLRHIWPDINRSGYNQFMLRTDPEIDNCCYITGMTGCLLR